MVASGASCLDLDGVSATVCHGQSQNGHDADGVSPVRPDIAAQFLADGDGGAKCGDITAMAP